MRARSIEVSKFDKLVHSVGDSQTPNKRRSSRAATREIERSATCARTTKMLCLTTERRNFPTVRVGKSEIPDGGRAVNDADYFFRALRLAVPPHEEADRLVDVLPNRVLL